MLLNNVRLIDGTGRVWERAAIRVEGERIAAVTDAVIPASDEEFLDLEARLRTLRQAEERLIAMLKRSGKLADLLEIERELATRREQIEKSQGRLRYLKDRVSFSTIQVSLYEKGPAVVGPSGPYDVVYHVRSAYRVLVSMLQGILTALVYIVVDGVVIWLPVLLSVWLIVRRRRRHQA